MHACIEVEIKPYKWNEMQRDLMAPELGRKVDLGENRLRGLRTLHTNILIKANTICNEYTEKNCFIVYNLCLKRVIAFVTLWINVYNFILNTLVGLDGQLVTVHLFCHNKLIRFFSGEGPCVPGPSPSLWVSVQWRELTDHSQTAVFFSSSFLFLTLSLLPLTYRKHLFCYSWVIGAFFYLL